MRSILICMASTGALVSPVLAHTGMDQMKSFASEMAHPLNGADWPAGFCRTNSRLGSGRLT